MKFLSRLLTVTLLLLTFAAVPAQAAAICTTFLSPGQPVPPWIAPGTILCLHGGNYPHGSPLVLTTNSATYQSAPGETARIVGVGITLYGHDVVLSHMEIDNGGTGGPSIPAIALKGDRETLDGLTVHSGHYNGIEVRGQNELLTGNTVHDFNASPADAECMVVFKTANHVRILNNTIHDCSGNGIELYTVDGVADPQVSHDVLIDGNNVKRGTVAHSETLIGIKHGQDITVTNNSLSGTEDYNWALGARGWVTNVLFANNHLIGNYTGIELGLFTNGGSPHHVLVTDNTVDNLGGLHGLNTESGGGFNLNLNGCFDCRITRNIFRNAGNYAVFVDGALGWRGGTFTGNQVINGVTPRLWPNSPFSDVLVGSNTWTNTSPGFLSAAGDMTQVVDTVTFTPTPTSTETPTATQTDTPFPTVTPTPTPLSGLCSYLLYWNGTRTITCPS